MNQTTDGKKKQENFNNNLKAGLAIGSIVILIVLALVMNDSGKFNHNRHDCLKWNVSYDYNGSLGAWSGEYWDAECDAFCRIDDPDCKLIHDQLGSCTELYENPELLDWENLNLECLEWK